MPEPKKNLKRNADNEKTQFIKPRDNLDTQDIPVKSVQRRLQNAQRSQQQNSRSRSIPLEQPYSEDIKGHPRPQSRSIPLGEPYPSVSQSHEPRHHTVGQPHMRNAQSRPASQGQQHRPPQNRQQNQRPKQTPPQKTPRKRRRSGLIGRLVLIFFIIFMLIFGMYSCTAFYFIGKMHKVDSRKLHNYNGLMSESYVKNILIIGSDARKVEDRGLSDSVILVSRNSKTKEIIITSFMRDCYVEIEGHGWNKLNYSYSKGGADLLIDTVERNFRVRIDDFIVINFFSFSSIVDAVGGIEVEMSDREAQELNIILQAEVNGLMGDPVDADLLPSGGKYKLNGKQALSYSRIRHVGNADFERTERQREVFTKIAAKAKTLNPVKLGKIMKNALPQIGTNMSTLDLYWLSLQAPFLLGRDVKQVRIPAEGTYSGQSKSGCGEVLVVDFDKNIKIIRDEIFG